MREDSAVGRRRLGGSRLRRAGILVVSWAASARASACPPRCPGRRAPGHIAGDGV